MTAGFSTEAMNRCGLPHAQSAKKQPRTPPCVHVETFRHMSKQALGRASMIPEWTESWSSPRSDVEFARPDAFRRAPRCHARAVDPHHREQRYLGFLCRLEPGCRPVLGRRLRGGGHGKSLAYDEAFIDELRERFNAKALFYFGDLDPRASVSQAAPWRRRRPDLSLRFGAGVYRCVVAISVLHRRSLATRRRPWQIGATFGATPEGHTRNSWRARNPYSTGFSRSYFKVAEREGFEPPIGLHLCRISSAVHSTTLPPLQGANQG